MGTPPSPPIRHRSAILRDRRPNSQLAMAMSEPRNELRSRCEGYVLWKDAWKRLLKNKLAVFGLIVVVTIIVVSLAGPPIIRGTTGFTYDYQPPEV